MTKQPETTAGEGEYGPCPDERCNDHLGSLPIPQCVTAVAWAEEASMIADTLRQLSDQFNRIDKGHCTICRQFRLYDTRSRMWPCENAECLSHRISEILTRYEKPSAATLARISRNCLQAIRELNHDPRPR